MEILKTNIFYCLTKGLRDKIQDTESWLSENGRDCKKQQGHLINGTKERIYWHYGYMMALKDILRFLIKEQSKLN
jgi:hypothetical protein